MIHFIRSAYLYGVGSSSVVGESKDPIMAHHMRLDDSESHASTVGLEDSRRDVGLHSTMDTKVAWLGWL